MKLLTTFLIFFSFTTLGGIPEVEVHFSINAKSELRMNPNIPNSIEVWFTNKETGEILKDFKVMHGKIMHMVLIKKDLSVFKHIHPYLDPVTGRFQITINMPLSDPDNYQTENTITTPGMYMLMADVDIKGVGMKMGHRMLMVAGDSPMAPLKLDPMDSANNTITKYFKKNETQFMTKLGYNTTRGCAGELIEFTLEIFEKDVNGEYVPGRDFVPWLSQGAHAVWASKGVMSKMKMHFNHMHADSPIDDSTFYFNTHNQGIMKDGPQRAWFQIKHKDKVLTFPFTFNYFYQGPIDCS